MFCRLPAYKAFTRISAETACNWLFTAFLQCMVSDTAYSRKTAINGNLRPFWLPYVIRYQKPRKQLQTAEPCQNRKIVYFDHIATLIIYGIRYHRTAENVHTRQIQDITGIPARTMPEAMYKYIVLPLRPIIKNRLKGFLRHFISRHVYIRRKAKSAGNRQIQGK